MRYTLHMICGLHYTHYAVHSLTASSMEEVECTVELTTQAVMAACSSDYTQVKQAEQLIHKLETRPGFHPILAVSEIRLNSSDIDVARLFDCTSAFYK